MTVNTKTFRYAHLLCIFMLMESVLPGCSSKDACMEEQQKTSAKTLTVSGPEHLSVGEQATLTVGIQNGLLNCVKEGEAISKNIGFDTLLISSKLAYTNDPITDECNCKTDSIIYTLFYFKPMNKGTYYFLTEKIDSTASSITPTKVLGLAITVD